MNTLNNLLIGLLLLLATNALAQDNDTNEWTSSRPDGHAPISVMGDHYHKKGELMFSYRYMPMWMEGSLSGSDDMNTEAVLTDFMVAPQKMQMNMHMLGVMYAPSDRITLMLMGNYISNSMDLTTRMGVDFTTASSGLGDLSFSGLIKIMNSNRHSLHANIGLSIPTGDIDQRDATPMAENAQLAYPMQLGTGTWDPFMGTTYLGQSDALSWGTQVLYKMRLGENEENYTFGNRFDATAWGAVKVSKLLSFSTSLSYANIGEIEGEDADLNPMMMPLFNSANSGRNQLDVGLGANFAFPATMIKGLRLAAEVKLPVAQSATGIQMKNTVMATFGLQYSIGRKK